MKQEAMFYEKLEDKKVQCFLCEHRCKIVQDKLGICGVRQNTDGKLYTLVYGELIAANKDPIEKKPLYHFLPGSYSYSIATVGCNFQCGFCQNWQISQASRHDLQRLIHDYVEPSQIVKQAKRNYCKSISFTYTEPTIYIEYALDIARMAKSEGLSTVFVTNGYMTREALKTISPFLDAANVDLKGYNDNFYKKVCKGDLDPVLSNIRYMRELNIWIELTTLVIPGENDSEEELKNIAEFIAEVDKNIPWHISAFHPDYQFNDHPPTPVETLKKALLIGQQCGLHYIYIGNAVADSNTYCHNCNSLLIERSGFSVSKMNINKNKCPNCKVNIRGVW